MKPVEILEKCITEALVDGDFNWETFFKKWFCEYGKPLFFLFKKNLSVTNTQFVELFSLITQHSTYELAPNIDSKLLFYSTEHIKITFSGSISSLLEGYDPKDTSMIKQFSEQYIDIFGATIAVDMFFGSCAVFIPNGISYNLEKIVSDSGYIHSAGKAILVRNIHKSNKNEFFANLDEHLGASCTTADNLIPFVVYAHEDFSEHDRGDFDEINKGIEECKIYVEKMSMGNRRLSSILREMQEKYEHKLFIPEAGSYEDKHNFYLGKTIWLISDRSLSRGQIRTPGSHRYYICYEQSLKNESPFYYFDENKPAWKSHTTIPHSLTAALINAARPISADGVICDPFAGTGTTWLEVKRMKLPNKLLCSDLSPATTTLLSDNVTFFHMTSDELINLVYELKRCSKTMKEQQTYVPGELSSEHSSEALKCLQILKAANKPDEDQEYVLSESFIDEFKKLPIETRFIFYICLRAELRYHTAIKRKSITFPEAFKKSLNKLLEQTEKLIELKREIKSKYSSINCTTESYIKLSSRYSFMLFPNFIYEELDSLLKNIGIEVASSFNAIHLEHKTDLIICDPPYGFNTTEEDGKLAYLYSEFIDKAIASLRPKGQLILCLPAESYTGRELPYCTRSDIISRQILVKAHKQGRLVYQEANSLPLASLYPPYYWESDRALRRTILHFRFQ